MANYPYISGQGALVAAFAQLRRNVPAKVDAGYLQRFNIAPANESYVISILRFVGLIDEDGNRVEANTGYLYGNDEGFKDGMESALREAYSELFADMGDDALEADKAKLTHWFRASDKTSELVGGRQAATFQTLAALAGHGELPAARTANGTKKATAAVGAVKRATTKKAAAKTAAEPPATDDGAAGAGDGGGGGANGNGRGKGQNEQGVGLTVRIEVNLPPGGDADTYDAIFASIKKHLMS